MANSNITTPLNLLSGGSSGGSNGSQKHLIWLLDYKTFGKNSYVYNDKDKLYELYEDYELSMNDNDICDEALSYILDKNTEVGLAFSKLYELGNPTGLSELTSIKSVLSDTNNGSLVMSKIASSDKFMKSVSNNTNALSAITTNGMALQYIAKNHANAMPFIKTCGLSSVYAKNIYKVLTDTNYFTLKSDLLYTSLSSANNVCTESYAANGLIAYALGYASAWSSMSITMNINDSISKTFDAGYELSSDSYNVGSGRLTGITIPVTTFGGQGRAAVAVFIANS